MKKIILFFFVMLFMQSHSFSQKKDTAVIDVDVSKSIGDRKPIWAWFGYDEPNYTYMKDGKKLLSELAALSPVPVYVRTHSLLVTGDGVAALKWGSTNAYTEDANGKPVYNWTIVDSIFDTYIQRGMKPLAQIGFMPEALSSHPQPYRHHWKPGDDYNDVFTGWAYPPNDYAKWGELVYQWVKHCVARYGKKEVESWYWEVWNEPDIAYWKGSLQEYCKLYDYSADAVKRALPSARIGGADVTGGGYKFLDSFIRHCLYDTNYVTGAIGSPLNLVSFHAKGSPHVANDTVVMGIRNQLQNIDGMLKLITSFPQLKNIPVIIGESDPEGCAACSMALYPQNAYRNGTLYSSYTAASFAREYELANRYEANLIGAVSWSFEFENQPLFYGFRDLATNGIDKPVLNVFRMFGMMKGTGIQAKSNHQYSLQTVLDSGIRKQTDVGVLASKNDKSAAVMIWNYGDVDRKGDTTMVTVNITSVPSKKVTLTQYRIDDAHSNAYEVWKKMGSPQSLSSEQTVTLQKAGDLQTTGASKILSTPKGILHTNIALPRQGVSLLKLSW